MITWGYNPSTRVHTSIWRFSDSKDVVSTIRKYGGHYIWSCSENDQLPEQAGLVDSLAEAKRAVENWLNKPAPEILYCAVCYGLIVTELKWGGSEYPFWCRHVHGAVELVVHNGELYDAGWRCPSCCTQKKEEVLNDH